MEAIASLRNDLQNLCTKVETQPSSYAEVVLSHPHPIEKKGVFRPNKNILPKPIEPKLTELNVSKGNRNRVVVEGARRIWGTLRSATNKSITNTLVRLTSIEASKMKLKRKSNTTKSNKERWWFVVHSDEGILTQLETQWQNVNLQTGWSIEKCTKPMDITDSCISQNSAITNSPADVPPDTTPDTGVLNITTNEPTQSQVSLQEECIPTTQAFDANNVQQPEFVSNQ